MKKISKHFIIKITAIFLFNKKSIIKKDVKLKKLLIFSNNYLMIIKEIAMTMKLDLNQLNKLNLIKIMKKKLNHSVSHQLDHKEAIFKNKRRL